MRTTTILVASALTLAMMASGTTGETERPAGDLIVGTSSGSAEVDYVESICLAPPTAVALVEDPGNAIPATCENGDWVRSGFSMTTGFSLLPYAQDGWTGHYESVIESAAGELRFRCTMDMGSLVSCEILSGVWPGVGAEFEHYCLAYESETGLEVPVELGDHDWGCWVGGDIEGL